MNNITIKTPKGERKIGSGNPVFIIAEMSGNHNQDIKRAYKIIDAAAEAGVDAIKLQTYTADTITLDSDKEYFQVKVNDAWKGQTLHSLYKKVYTPWDWQPKLKEYAEKKGLFCFSCPFDVTAVDFLEKMDVELYKVASFEVIDIPLLKRIAQTKKPVIMSRGLASEEEIEYAIKVLKDNGCPNVAVLHCISSYPAKAEEMNLATIPDIVKKFKVIAGLSDHSLVETAPVTSVVLGASIIEKHLTLSRSDGGADSAFSLEPDEFKELVKSIREAETAIGKPSYGAGIKESENIIFRKSLFVVEYIKKGEELTEKNVRSIRPGHGLHTKHYEEIIGKVASKDIERGTPLSWELIVNSKKYGK
jgi:pseudaminic acid synthase